VGHQTPAVLKTRRSNTGADPKARRHLRLGEPTETDGGYTNSFAELPEQYDTDEDGSSEEEEEEDYDVMRALKLTSFNATVDARYAQHVQQITSGEGEPEVKEQKIREAQDASTGAKERYLVQDAADHSEHCQELLLKLAASKKAKKEAKADKRRCINNAISRLLGTMNGEEDAILSSTQDDVPHLIRWESWFGYIYRALQDDTLLVQWSEEATEKADFSQLHPEKATAAQRAQYYITLMEEYQEVHRHKTGTGKGRAKTATGGAAPAGCAHACPYFKIRGRCGHGNAISCGAGLHDARRRFESKAIASESRAKWGEGKGKGKRVTGLAKARMEPVALVAPGPGVIGKAREHALPPSPRSSPWTKAGRTACATTPPTDRSVTGMLKGNASTSTRVLAVPQQRLHLLQSSRPLPLQSLVGQRQRPRAPMLRRPCRSCSMAGLVG
jgi:hypothetical protein